MDKEQEGLKASRRDFGRLMMGGALGLTALGTGGSSALAVQGSSTPTGGARRRIGSDQPGIKMGIKWRPDPSDDDLLFLRQIGVTHISCTIGSMANQGELPTLAQMQTAKARFENAGFVVHKFLGPLSVPAREIACGLPGRDEKIAQFNRWIELNAQCGLYYVGVSYMATGVWASGRAETRGAGTREFNAAAPSFQNNYRINEPAFDRVYSRDEAIANYEYFIRRIAPVAERNNVAVAFHPDDVPVYPMLAGFPRIFNNFNEIKARLAQANSPNIGFIMCCGTWMEGGDGMGASVEDAIRHFVGNHQTWEIHFRNVSSTIPHFHETFMDNGMFDMYKIMKTAYDTGFRELIHLDHDPRMVGAPYAYPAYALGYMHACHQRAAAGSSVGRCTA